MMTFDKSGKFTINPRRNFLKKEAYNMVTLAERHKVEREMNAHTLPWRRNLNLSYPDCMTCLRNTIQGYPLGSEGQHNGGQIVHRWLLQRL